MVRRENGIGQGFGVALLRLPVIAYRQLISPALPRACRYHPSCSVYMLEALRVHGPWLGLWLGLRRLARCHPWSQHPPHDPVPERCLRPPTTL